MIGRHGGRRWGGAERRRRRRRRMECEKCLEAGGEERERETLRRDRRRVTEEIINGKVVRWVRLLLSRA